jgi:uncharacterized protein (TIGR03067 family)
MSRIRFVAVLGLTLGACAATLAQDPPKAKEPTRLDIKALGEMLTDMGIETKLAENRFQTIRWTVKDWETPVWLTVSASKRTVWLFTNLGLPTASEKAPAEAWRKLLEKNDAIAPNIFSLDEKGKRLTFRRPVLNAGLTPAQLRKELNTFAETLQKSQSLWQGTAFLPPMTPEALKVQAQLEGTWQVTASTDRGKRLPGFEVAKDTFVFEKNQVRVLKDGKEALKATLYIELAGGKTLFELVTDDFATSVDVGILKLEGDTLTMCSNSGTGDRPTEFTSTEKSNSILLVLKRRKP